jgi:hypothetical protein
VARLLDMASSRMTSGGRVLAELDPSILSHVVDVADRRFSHRQIHHDLGGHVRVLEAWS